MVTHTTTTTMVDSENIAYSYNNDDLFFLSYITQLLYVQIIVPIDVYCLILSYPDWHLRFATYLSKKLTDSSLPQQQYAVM